MGDARGFGRTFLHRARLLAVTIGLAGCASRVGGIDSGSDAGAIPEADVAVIDPGQYGPSGMALLLYRKRPKLAVGDVLATVSVER